jgi:hypothetical protein
VSGSVRPESLLRRKILKHESRNLRLRIKLDGHASSRFDEGCLTNDTTRPVGLQFFGRVDIDGKTGVMTVTLKDVEDNDLWSVDIAPKPDARLLQRVTSR